MKSFEDTWKSLPMNVHMSSLYDKYNDTQLDAVKFGWELALQAVLWEASVNHSHALHERLDKERLAKIAHRYKKAEEYEAEGNYDLAERIRPCCPNENRSMNGGCASCGDPCL